MVIVIDNIGNDNGYDDDGDGNKDVNSIYVVIIMMLIKFDVSDWDHAYDVSADEDDVIADEDDVNADGDDVIADEDDVIADEDDVNADGDDVIADDNYNK